MATGVPVIGARVGGVPEILTHGVNGWLVEPGDSAVLAAGLRTLWADPALRRQVAEEGGRTSVRFDVTRAAAELQAEYERMVWPSPITPMNGRPLSLFMRLTLWQAARARCSTWCVTLP